MNDLHVVRITSPHGDYHLTNVELDGKRLEGLTALSLRIGPNGRGTEITLTMLAGLEFDGEAQVRATTELPSVELQNEHNEATSEPLAHLGGGST